ncbi:hypothetical protein EAF04_006564 [Stromatinia cepivora]|nr:hypothetical protein EAF04_006564 [Stromatinia cepivora]
MGKSDLIPQTQPKRRVRPISNPLYFDDESFFCNIIKHHNLRPEEQFPALNRLYSVSIEHEARFYLECHTFYAFTLEFMNSERSKESTEDASALCHVSRPKSYRKPAKYDIQPLPPIDESTESIESIQEKWKNAGPSAPAQMAAGHNIDDCEDGQAPSMTSSLPSAVLSSNGTTSFGLPPSTTRRLSPMSQMIQDLEYPPSSMNIDCCSNDHLDSIHDNESETPIANINGIKSSDHDGIEAITIHSISANPAIKGLHRVQLTSRFSNLMYDAQYDRYVKKPKTEMEGGSRSSVDLQIDGLYAAADRVQGKKGKALGKMQIRAEAAIMKYTNSDRVAGVRPLRMKPQVQPSNLYRDVKNGLGNGDEEDVVKGHLRLASDPERIGSPGADQQISRLRSDTIPIKRISRHPSANISRKLGDLPTLTRQKSRRRKVGLIYLPATENENTSLRRPFTPVNRRSPSPRIRPIRSPPPTDRPYRHISQLSLNGIPRVNTPPAQDCGSDESNSSPIVVDITSFVPPTAITTSPTLGITSLLPTSTTTISPTIPETPVKLPSYTLDLPKIFSTPSPISLPLKLPSATPATLTTNSNSDSNISPPTISNQQSATAKSSIYSIYTPESSPHNSATLPPTLSLIPSIPSPPNTPTTCLFRSNTVSTNPSSATQGTYSHTRNNTISTLASSITSPIASPSLNTSPFLGASPFVDASPFLEASPSLKASPCLDTSSPAIPSPNPRISNLSQESIALTEHLVREGIYGGIVYDVVKTTDPYPTHPDPPSTEDPIPHLTQKLTPFQLHRKKKRAGRKLHSALRKREKKEKQEKKAEERKNRKTLKKVKAKTRKAKLAVQSKRGTVNYFQIRVFFRGLGNGVRMRLQGARRRLGEVQISRILGARPERLDVGDGYDFVCRGESEDKN